MTVKRGSWLKSGNFDTDDVEDYIGTNDLDALFNVQVNSSFGGQQIVATWDPNNIVAGGPAFDLRPGEAVFLPQFILMGNTMRLIATENAIASSLTFELNNDQGAGIRRMLLSTSDTGTFGSLQFLLGDGAQENQIFSSGVFDFQLSNFGLNKALLFEVNVGGVQTPVVEVKAVGSIQATIPQTSIHGTVGILEGENVTYGTAPFNILACTPTVNSINTGNARNICFNTNSIWNFTSQQTNIFSSTVGLSTSTRMIPTNNAQNHQLRSILGQSIFQGGGASTITAIQGVFGQAAVQSGTATLCTGVIGQSLTIFGGTITEAIGVLANPYVAFLGGSCVTAVSLRSVGGTTAATNWNAQFQGDVPSYHEGDWIVGQITQTANAFKFHLNGHQKVSDNFGIFFGGTTNSDATFGILDELATSRIRLGSAGNDTNNSRLLFDFETTANIIDVTGASSGTIPGIIWDLTSNRFNGDWGFGIAPTTTQSGFTTMSNLNTLRTGDRNTMSLGEALDILGTLIEDLKAKGVIAA